MPNKGGVINTDWSNNESIVWLESNDHQQIAEILKRYLQDTRSALKDDNKNQLLSVIQKTHTAIGNLVGVENIHYLKTPQKTVELSKENTGLIIVKLNQKTNTVLNISTSDGWNEEQWQWTIWIKIKTEVTVVDKEEKEQKEISKLISIPLE